MLLAKPFTGRPFVKCRSYSDDSKLKNVSKNHYEYKRMIFNSFIYNHPEYLTQAELRSLVKDHKLRIQCRNNRLYLNISPDKWGDKESEVWDCLVYIFNDWSLTNLLREELSVFPETLDASLMIPLQMQFIRMNSEETKYDDWIDHA